MRIKMISFKSFRGDRSSIFLILLAGKSQNDGHLQLTKPVLYSLQAFYHKFRFLIGHATIY